jgi:hypothetical protein
MESNNKMTERTHSRSFDFFFFDNCRLRYLMKTTYNDYDATVASFVSAMTEPTHSRISNVTTAAISTGSWTNPGPAQDDHDNTNSEPGGHSQDTPNRKPPPNPHSLQAHVTSWLENNNEPSFAQFQLLYKALLNEEPEEFAELIDNHFESDEPSRRFEGRQSLESYVSGTNWTKRSVFHPKYPSFLQSLATFCARLAEDIF